MSRLCSPENISYDSLATRKDDSGDRSDTVVPIELSSISTTETTITAGHNHWQNQSFSGLQTLNKRRLKRSKQALNSFSKHFCRAEKPLRAIQADNWTSHNLEALLRAPVLTLRYLVLANPKNKYLHSMHCWVKGKLIKTYAPGKLRICKQSNRGTGSSVT